MLLHSNNNEKEDDMNNQTNQDNLGKNQSTGQNAGQGTIKSGTSQSGLNQSGANQYDPQAGKNASSINKDSQEDAKRNLGSKSSVEDEDESVEQGNSSSSQKFNTNNQPNH